MKEVTKLVYFNGLTAVSKGIYIIIVIKWIKNKTLNRSSIQFVQKFQDYQRKKSNEKLFTCYFPSEKSGYS